MCIQKLDKEIFNLWQPDVIPVVQTFCMQQTFHPQELMSAWNQMLESGRRLDRMLYKIDVKEIFIP